MSNRDTDFGAFLVGFIVGGLVGGAVALLLAPQSGEETRTLIKEKSIELKDKAVETAEEARARAEAAAEDARARAEEWAQIARERAEELRNAARKLSNPVENVKKAAPQHLLNHPPKHNIYELKKNVPVFVPNRDILSLRITSITCSKPGGLP